MADRRRPTRPRTRCSPRPSEEGRGRLKIFLGAAPGRRQDLRHAARPRATRRATGVDVVVGLVETHGRARDRGAAATGSRSCRAARIDYQRPAARARFDLDAAARAPAALVAGRRTRPHQRRRQPPSQALAGCRGTARRRHRRLHHAQCPAPRKPERRRRTHHRRHACARPCPTRCCERADEIELIDLPPEELIERLRQGKVYVPAQIAAAPSRTSSPRAT